MAGTNALVSQTKVILLGVGRLSASIQFAKARVRLAEILLLEEQERLAC